MEDISISSESRYDNYYQQCSGTSYAFSSTKISPAASPVDSIRSSSSSATLVSNQTYTSNIDTPYVPALTSKNYSRNNECKEKSTDRIHIVKSTDTLEGVSLLYGCQISELKRLNKIWTNDSIHLRTQLLIPTTPHITESPNKKTYATPTSPVIKSAFTTITSVNSITPKTPVSLSNSALNLSQTTLILTKLNKDITHICDAITSLTSTDPSNLPTILENLVSTHSGVPADMQDAEYDAWNGTRFEDDGSVVIMACETARVVAMKRLTSLKLTDDSRRGSYGSQNGGNHVDGPQLTFSTMRSPCGARRDYLDESCRVCLLVEVARVVEESVPFCGVLRVLEDVRARVERACRGSVGSSSSSNGLMGVIRVSI